MAAASGLHVDSAAPRGSDSIHGSLSGCLQDGSGCRTHPADPTGGRLGPDASRSGQAQRRARALTQHHSGHAGPVHEPMVLGPDGPDAVLAVDRGKGDLELASQGTGKLVSGEDR